MPLPRDLCITPVLRGSASYLAPGERPVPSSAAGARCLSLLGDAVLSPRLAERQIRASST